MLKTACNLTGDNYKLLTSDTPASKKKVVAMALAMIIPVLIWFFNGFMLSFQVLNMGLGWSILIGIVCASVVFVIEKLVIMANGNHWLTKFRIAIGFIIAVLGSIAIDEVVFKGDIDTQVAAMKTSAIALSKTEASADFTTQTDIGNLNTQIKEAQLKYDNAAAAVIAEADGSYGTKRRGVGKITELKERKAKERKTELDVLHAQKTNANRVKDSVMSVAGLSTGNSFNEHALLTRVKALFQLVSKDKYMLITYALFTLLLFFFEFLVVILKSTWKKTNYERRVEMIEEIGRKRMEFLQKPASALLDPGYYSQQFQGSRELVNKSHSLFNN